MGLREGIAKTIAGGVLSRATGAVSGLISMKVLLGIFTGVALVMGFTIWHQSRQLTKVNEQVTGIRTAVAEVAGVPVENLQVTQIAATVRTIGTDRDTARREATNFKKSASDQSDVNRTLAGQTAAAKAQAARAVARVSTVVADRNKWIAVARNQAQRTTHQPDPVELKHTEEVFDALYTLGF